MNNYLDLICKICG